MILHLSLYSQHFVDILAGTKRIEYRRRCARWDKMLTKGHTHMHMVNGYGAHRPWLDAKIARIEKTADNWLIHIEAVTGSGNLHLLCPALTMIESSSFPST